MAVTPIGSMASSYTDTPSISRPGSGSDLFYVVLVHVKALSDTVSMSASLVMGGVTLSLLGWYSAVNTSQNAVGVYYANHAQIAAMTDTAGVISGTITRTPPDTFSTGGNTVLPQVHQQFFHSVDQANPFIATVGGNDNTETLTSFALPTLATENNGYAVALCGFHRQGTLSWTGALTELSEQNDNPGPTNLGSTTAGAATTGSSITDAVSSTSASAGRVAIIGFSLRTSIRDAVTKGDITLTGYAVNELATDPVTKGDITLTGKTVSDVVIDPVTKGDITLTGHAVNELVTDPVTKGNLTFAGQSIIDVVLDIVTKGDVIFTGQSILDVVMDTVTKGDIVLTGQIINEAGSVTDTITAAALTLAGSLIGEIVYDQLTKGDLAFTGQVIGESAVSTLDVLTAWSITLTGFPIEETIEGTIWVPTTPASSIWSNVDDPENTWTPIEQGTRPWQTQ